jgi:hypothetical protein
VQPARSGNFPRGLSNDSTTTVIAAALALAVTLPAVSAQAQSPRTFVSAAGSDSNNCANVAAPCRHFAAAFAATAPGGEIFVLDPANYGSLTITHAVSIEGHGWASIAPPNNGNAITINADSSDNISIHGVAINGTGATGSTNGIVFNSGYKLAVIDCFISNFTAYGIVANVSTSSQEAPTDISITGTVVSDSIGGIVLLTNGTAGWINATLDHLTLDNNFASIEFVGVVHGLITNTVIGQNNGDGESLYLNGANTGYSREAWAFLKNVYMNQAGVNIYLAGFAQVRMMQSTLFNVAPNEALHCTGTDDNVFSDGTNVMTGPIFNCPISAIPDLH